MKIALEIITMTSSKDEGEEIPTNPALLQVGEPFLLSQISPLSIHFRWEGCSETSSYHPGGKSTWMYQSAILYKSSTHLQIMNLCPAVMGEWDRDYVRLGGGERELENESDVEVIANLTLRVSKIGLMRNRWNWMIAVSFCSSAGNKHNFNAFPDFELGCQTNYAIKRNRLILQGVNL